MPCIYLSVKLKWILCGMIGWLKWMHFRVKLSLKHSLKTRNFNWWSSFQAIWTYSQKSYHLFSGEAVLLQRDNVVWASSGPCLWARKPGIFYNCKQLHRDSSCAYAILSYTNLSVLFFKKPSLPAGFLRTVLAINCDQCVSTFLYLWHYSMRQI